MRAGLLNRRVLVENPVETRSASGEITRTWAEWKRVWAAVLPVAGQKFFQASQLQVEVTHTVRVRFQPGFRTDQRITHEVEPGVSQRFEVMAVLPVRDEKTFIDLMCIQRESEGFRP